jgi:hypothetical protein
MDTSERDEAGGGDTRVGGYGASALWGAAGEGEGGNSNEVVVRVVPECDAEEVVEDIPPPENSMAVDEDIDADADTDRNTDERIVQREGGDVEGAMAVDDEATEVVGEERPTEKEKEAGEVPSPLQAMDTPPL